jgi:hypothetical protein
MVMESREGSRMSKTLDYLAREGIDCMKITGPGYDGLKTIFFPINMENERNFINTIKTEYKGRIRTDDFMEIELDSMAGYELKKLNPRFGKLDGNRSYKVLKISYK